MCAPEGLGTTIGQPSASLACFVLPLFKRFMIVFSAHSNTVLDAPLKDTDPSSSCLLKVHLTGSSYECHCHMDNNYHNCTSIGNHQNENLRCKKSTVCLPEHGTCYKCDLKSMQRTICCDDVSTTGTPPIFKCGERRCSQNSESRKTSRYYKKTTATLNLNIQQILINASCLVSDSKNDCIKRFESSIHE